MLYSNAKFELNGIYSVDIIIVAITNDNRINYEICTNIINYYH